MYIYTQKKTPKICLIPITPCFTSPFLKSISLLKRFKVRRLPSSREFHFCCMASAFASLWSNNELLLAYEKKHTRYLQVHLEHVVKQQYKISLQKEQLSLQMDNYVFLWCPTSILLCICWHLPSPLLYPKNGLIDVNGTAHTSCPYAPHEASWYSCLGNSPTTLLIALFSVDYTKNKLVKIKFFFKAHGISDLTCCNSILNKSPVLECFLWPDRSVTMNLSL